MDKKEYTVSEIVDSFGMNATTWVMFVLLACAMIFDGYDFMIVNSTNLFVAHTFWPDNPNPGALMGSLTTWGLLGMVLGGAVGGILSDKIGRKKMLIIAVIFYGFFTLPQAFANDLGFFAAFRLIAGFGVGSCIPIVTTVFSETMPSQHRGVFVSIGMAGMVAGWVLAGVLAAPICNSADQLIPFANEITYVVDETGATATMYTNWRLCYLIGALPVIYGIILIFAMQETPHWFANSGDKAGAVVALQKLAKRAGKPELAADLDPNMMVVPPRPKSVSPNVLFSKKFIVATCAIWSLYFIGQFCVYGMNAWLPTWFKGIGYTPAEAVQLQTWNNFAAILSNVSVGFVSDRIGRKKNLIFSWAFCIVAIILCSVFVAPNNFVFCIALMLLFGFALNYAITAVQPLMPESYPTAIRNTGVSWCQAFARFGGSASSIVLGAIAGMAMFQTAEGATNWSMVVLVLNVPFVLGLVCTFLFVQKETAGKSMDELAADDGDENDNGMVAFGVMLVIIALLFCACIVCPLVIPGFSKLPIALPIMATGLLLPFVFFFVFGGKQLAASK